jgi:hypothetical protein
MASKAIDSAQMGSRPQQPFLRLGHSELAVPSGARCAWHRDSINRAPVLSGGASRSRCIDVWGTWVRRLDAPRKEST